MCRFPTRTAMPPPLPQRCCDVLSCKGRWGSSVVDKSYFISNGHVYDDHGYRLGKLQSGRPMVIARLWLFCDVLIWTALFILSCKVFACFGCPESFHPDSSSAIFPLCQSPKLSGRCDVAVCSSFIIAWRGHIASGSECRMAALAERGRLRYQEWGSCVTARRFWWRSLTPVP